MNIYNVCVKTALLYNIEATVLTEAGLQKLEAAHKRHSVEAAHRRHSVEAAHRRHRVEPAHRRHRVTSEGAGLSVVRFAAAVGQPL